VKPSPPPAPRRPSALPGVRALPRLLGVLAVTTLAACEESFSPIQPSDLQFSVYGYLDASADTQWIRVGPIRPTLFTSPEPLGATVTLEHLGSGRVVELRDSVFDYSQRDPEIASDGVYAHNYWTAEHVEAGAAYRFSARRGDAPASETVVQIPTDYDVEVWIAQQQATRGDYVRIVGLRYVAFVQTTTRFHDRCGPGTETTSFPVDSVDGDVHTVPITRAFRFRGGCGAPVVERQEVRVVGSGAPWPSDRELGVGEEVVTGPPSGLSNSVGFIAGVLTKRVPYEACELDPPEVDHCRLVYDATTATLAGTVRDALCGDAPVPGATVRLREIAAPSRIRTATTDPSGAYQIGALDVGRRYALSVRATVGDGEQAVTEYEEHADTLAFASGGRVAYDVELRRVGPCPPGP
jgi:hypothetical protein